MLKVENNKIILTRGDSAFLDVTISNSQGKAFEMQDGDKLVFTLKTDAQNAEPILQKEVLDYQIVLKPSDTAGLPYGTYFYDVQLQTADGDVFTIILPTAFILGGEVTWN